MCVVLWSVKRGTAVVRRTDRERGRRVSVERKKRNDSTTNPPLMIVLWLDSNTEHKGWSRQTPLVRLNRSAAKRSGSQEHPPQYGRLTVGRGVKGSRTGRRARGETAFPPPALKAPVQSPPQCVSSCAPASPAWSCCVHRKTLHSFSSGI